MKHLIYEHLASMLLGKVLEHRREVDASSRALDYDERTDHKLGRESQRRLIIMFGSEKTMRARARWYSNAF